MPGIGFKVALGFVLCLCIRYAASSCSEGQACTTDDGGTGICLSQRCLVQLPLYVRENLTFTITVKYPEKNLMRHGLRDLHIRGNGLGFNWMTGQKLQKLFTDTWEVTVIYRQSIDGFQCHACADQSYLDNGKFQFRVLADDRVDMLGPNFAVRLPMSKSSEYFKTSPNINTYPWFFSKSGTYENLTLESPQIGGNRTVSVYFPPSFHENTYNTYPVLFVTDLKVGYAQIKPYAFEELMYPRGVTKEFVVIGFEDYKNYRTTLLTTPVGPEMYCKQGTYSNNCDNCYSDDIVGWTPQWFQVLRDKCGYRYYTGGKADDTIAFLTDTVLPAVQNLSEIRLSENRDDIGLMGYSHGGFLACHAAWTRPEHFGFAACLSSSFWWPFNNVTLTTCDFNFINKTLKELKYLRNRPPQKIYIDAGGAEGSEPYMTKEAVIEVAEYLDSLDFFTMNRNLWVHIFPGEHHNYYAWLRRAWNALSVMLPAEGASKMPSTSGASAQIIG